MVDLNPANFQGVSDNFRSRSGAAGGSPTNTLALKANLTLDATMANGGLNRTDARWFDAAGIPVAWPVVGYAEYHTDGDTLAAVDASDLEAIAAATADLAADVAVLPIGRVPAPFAPPD